MKRCIGPAKPHRTVFSLFRKILRCLKKWFISSFPEIEKISQNLGPNLGQKWWQIEYLMKRCIGSEKNLTEPFFAFSQDITMLKKWFISSFPEIAKISQNLGPNLGQKLWQSWIFNEKVHRIRKTSQDQFFAFSQDITILKKWFISSFPEIEKISQNLGPNLGQKWWQIEYLMKRCIGSAKPHRTAFRFFARYYDPEEVIHQLISWNWENIPKSGPKVRPKMMTNWIFNEKVHRIRQTSQNRFSLFRTILRCWRSDR